MPEGNQFESREAYYSTLFHELTHSTGHISRLNRKEVTGPISYGSDPYSREELVAEMGAAFLCGHCEIENTTLDQSANYIHNWLERLKDDRKLIVQAAAQAQKACDFIIDVKVEDEEPTENTPKEFHVAALHERATQEEVQLSDCPQKAANCRLLKIEADGDFFKGRIRPIIRLKGRWLEHAGFKPGNHVNVKCVAHGVIELCSSQDTDCSETIKQL